MNHPGGADRPAAHHRAPRGLRQRARSSPAASRVRGPRSASTGTCAARCFVRRLKADVLPQLPAKKPGRSSPSPWTTRSEYRLAEDDVIAWLREQPLELVRARGAGRGHAARRAPRPAQHPQAPGRRAASSPPRSAWIDDFLASEEPLVVFSGVPRGPAAAGPPALPGSAAHRRRRLRSRSANEAAVDAFQDRDGPRLIVCATRVAGQGITLTRASNVAFLDLEWTPAMHDQAEDRLHRIGQDDAVTAWYLLAARSRSTRRSSS